MLERFGLSIRAGKARAVLLQMTQGKMTVLEYFDAFESYLAQIEDYNESFYLAKFILDFDQNCSLKCLHSIRQLCWKLRCLLRH